MSTILLKRFVDVRSFCVGLTKRSDEALVASTLTLNEVFKPSNVEGSR